MMFACILKLRNRTMPVNQARKKADLPPLSGRKIRRVFRPWLPDVVGKICRYNGGIQERDSSIVLILPLPITSKQPQANRSPQDAPIGQPRTADCLPNT